MSETEEAIPADRVVETLEILLRAPPFLRSPKLARFLRFVVEEELAGRGATVKAYTIATQALGRGPDFDASLDPSVGSRPAACGGRWTTPMPSTPRGSTSASPCRWAATGPGSPAWRRCRPPGGCGRPGARGAPAPPGGGGRTAPDGGRVQPPRQAAVIALLAGILLVLCIDLGLTLSARLSTETRPPRDVAARSK